MLVLRSVHKFFGVVQILNGIILCLEKGYVYTLKGGNWSNKTIQQIVFEKKKITDSSVSTNNVKKNINSTEHCESENSK